MQKFRDLKIRTRLIILFLILALLPLLAALGIFYWEFTSSTQAKIATYSQQIMRQIAQNLAHRVAYLSSASIEIEFSGPVQQTLKQYDVMSEWEIFKAEHEMEELTSRKFYSLGNVSDVLIYTPQQRRLIAYGDPGLKLNLREEYLKYLFQRCWDRNGAIVWDAVGSEEEDYMVRYAMAQEAGKKPGVLLARMIRSLEDGRNLGYMVMRANESAFADVYRDADLGAGTKIFVMNSAGRILSSTEESLPIAGNYPDPALLKLLQQQAADRQQVFDYGDCLVSFSLVEGADWFVVSLIPYSYIYSNAAAAFVETGLIVLAGFLAALGLAYRFSATLLRPLDRLRQAMQRAQIGNLQGEIEPEYNDEIGELTRRFNQMLRHIRELIERVQQRERQKRQAELQALQAQINPHFLSNTLNTVRFLAQVQNAHNIEEITTSLINMFQFMVGRGEEMVTVRQEIAYIRDYINVQEYRYLDKFSITYDIEPEVLDCRLPKMLLQPLVENSLIHGIAPMEGQGLLSLKGYREAEELRLILTDNGVGIEKEILAHLFEREGQDHHRGLSGIGFANVDERIKLYFGDAYGLQIESVPGFYTTVVVRLPLVWGRDEDV